MADCCHTPESYPSRDDEAYRRIARLEALVLKLATGVPLTAEDIKMGPRQPAPSAWQALKSVYATAFNEDANVTYAKYFAVKEE